MNAELATELIKLIPSILWILFVAVLIAVLYKPIRYEMLPRLSGFKAFGVETTFVIEELNKAVEKRSVQVSENDRSQVFKRVRRISPILQGSQILWVDDNPDNNLYERRILRSFGIFVDLARSTDEALTMLTQTKYDVIISDMNREGIEDEGLRFLNKTIQRGLHRYTIFYAARFDPSKGIPPYAFGMTNRPDHLIHYILDALEREKC